MSPVTLPVAKAGNYVPVVRQVGTGLVAKAGTYFPVADQCTVPVAKACIYFPVVDVDMVTVVIFG